MWFVWAAIDPIPLIQDEYSYVLQSRIFATGHWTAPSPPIPLFFQQAHVLTTPAVASKFAPGTALLMSIGSLVGAPVLIPLLLTGLTAALLFLLVRRVANTWTAVFAVTIWLSDPINLRFRAGYFSEITSGAMWLVAWWALLEWRESRKLKWMLALAAAIGWGAITRPLTMLAFAVPVAIVVLRDVVAIHRWRDLAAGLALGTLIVGIIPLWSRMTTGDWTLTPQTLYTRRYIPFDKPGFGADSTRPSEPLAPPQREVYDEFFAAHVHHVPANLPRIAWDRLREIAMAEWRNARIVLVPFALFGLFSLVAPITFALWCAVALFVAYLSYGHAPAWTLYYLEATPVIAAITAIGVERFAVIVQTKTPVAAVRTMAFALLGILTFVQVRRARTEHLEAANFDRAFLAAVDRLPTRAAVIFVHYSPTLQAHANIVSNSPNLDEEPLWIVHDLGERDRELMRFARARVPIAFYEDGGRFELDRSLLPARAR